MESEHMDKRFRIAIHSLIVIILGILLGLLFWNLKYNEYPSFVETCGKLVASGKVQRAAFRGVFSLVAVWLVATVLLRHLKGEILDVASDKVIRSFLPFLLLFLLFVKKWSGVQTDFVVIAFIFSASLAVGLLASLFVEFERVRGYDRAFKVTLLILIVLASAWFIRIVLIDFNDFRFIDEDFAVFDTSIRSVLRGECLRSSLHGNKSQLGCHFSPILFLIAPFYLIYDNPRILFFFQIIPVLAAAFVVYLLAKEKLENPLLAFCFGAGYLLLPHVHSVAFNEFHAANMIPPFVLLTFYFLLKRNFKAYWVFLLLMISCREELFLTGAAIGIVTFFLPWKTAEERRQNRRIGLATLVGCVVLAVIAVKFVIPHYAGSMEDGHPNYPIFSWLGNTPAQMVAALLRHPGKAFKFLFLDERWGPHRWRSLCFTFLPMILLPFFGKRTLLLPLAAIALPFMSHSHYMFRLAMQYSASVSPSVAISAIFGASYVIAFSGRSSKFKSKIADFLGKRSAMTVIGVGLVMSCVLYSRFFGYLPFSRDFDERGNVFCGSVERPFRKRAGIRSRSRVTLDCIKMVPRDASVCTQIDIGHHLGHHSNFQRYWGYNEQVYGPDRCDYVLLNLSWKVGRSDLIRLLGSGEYGVLEHKDRVLLLKSNHTTEKNEWAYNQMFVTFNVRYLSSHAGEIVADPEATSGYARFVYLPKIHPTKAAFTRSVVNLPLGKHKINFILKTDRLIPDRAAILQAVLPQGNILVAEREIKGSDFLEVNKYQSFSLNFDLSEDKNIQLRVIYIGKIKLWIDSIQIKSGMMSLSEAYRRIVR